jgi:hypothetical protein
LMNRFMRMESPNEQKNPNGLSNKIIQKKGKSDRRSEEGTLTPAHKRCSRSGLASGRIRHKNLKWQVKKFSKLMGKVF